MNAATSELPADFLEALVELLGEDGVLRSPEQLADFRDPFWIAGDDTYAAAAVACPTSVEQVQAIVRLAGTFDVPLWTFSQGRNNAYGGASPRVAGSLQVSLRGMNQVLEINEELAYAVVEPGVRWIDLHAALEAGGHRLRLSVPDIGWGSVIGNALDGGVTYLPTGQDFLAPCGMEVVLADGSLLRTGMGATPGNPAAHIYRRSVGPTLDPLFIQSNFGIITKMGVWLNRTPETYQRLLLGMRTDADLEQGVEILRELLLDGTARGVPTIYGAPLNYPHLLDGPRPEQVVWTEDELEAHGQMSGIGRWTIRLGLWETDEVRAAKLEHIRRKWSSIAGSSIYEGRVYRPEEYGEITNSTEQVQVGIPNLAMLDSLLAGGRGHLDVSPVVPLTGEWVRKVIQTISRTLERPSGGGIHAVSARSAIIVTGLDFQIDDEAAIRRALSIADTLLARLSALGLSEYRSHIHFMDEVAGNLSYNDHAYHRFLTRIKEAVDPQGILAPGRYGIWPRQKY